MSKCVICGAELPLDMTQLCFATKKKGVEGACMAHEHSKLLENYANENGGYITITEALEQRKEEEQ